MASGGIWIGLSLTSNTLNPSFVTKNPLESKLKFPALVSLSPFAFTTKKASFCFKAKSKGFEVLCKFPILKFEYSSTTIGTLFKFLFKNLAAFFVLFSIGKISRF